MRTIRKLRVIPHYSNDTTRAKGKYTVTGGLFSIVMGGLFGASLAYLLAFIFSWRIWS